MPTRPSKRPARPSGPGAPLLPDGLPPMLARSAAEPFDSPDHLFEIKWDGTRCIAIIEATRLRLQNRRLVDMAARYPELSGLAGLPPGTVLDGEIVVLEEGKPSFRKLMQREHVQDPQRIDILRRSLPATLIAFDLLFLEGRSLMDQPLVERRILLRRIVASRGDAHLLAPDHVLEHGRQYFDAVQRVGLEGVMAKRLDSRYLPGQRSNHWLKIKVARTGRYAVLGYAPGTHPGTIAALLLGELYRGRWTFKGKVGSGLNDTQRHRMFEEMRDMPVLANPPKDGPAGAVWRDTGWTCQVRFLEKTETGKLRAPVFEGIVESPDDPTQT